MTWGRIADAALYKGEPKDGKKGRKPYTKLHGATTDEGKTLTVQQLVDDARNIHGITYQTMWQRVHRGATGTEALFAPPHTRGRLRKKIDEE